MKLLTKSLSILAVGGILADANAASRWMYPRIDQSVAYFPDLVAASGERIFKAYWVDEGEAEGADDCVESN